MASGGIRLSREWREFIDSMDPRAFETRLARALTVAGTRSGQRFQRSARRAIRSRKYAPNSPITTIIKGISTPLVAGGDLFQSLTYRVASPYEVQLGIQRRTVGERGINIAATLHEGATINVRQHPGVRRAVWAKVSDRLGSDLSSLPTRSRAAVRRAARRIGYSPPSGAARRGMFAAMRSDGRLVGRPRTGADVWIIPARPFITAITTDPAFHRFILDQYAQAVRAAFSGGR